MPRLNHGSGGGECEKYGEFLPDTGEDGWTVVVTEDSAPPNYNRDELEDGGFTATLHLSKGQTELPFTYKDTSYRDVEIIKKDAETGWLLKGAVFAIKCIALDDPKGDPGNIEERQKETDKDGRVLFEDLPNGTYEIWEVSPPDEYEADGEWEDGSTDKRRTIVLDSDSRPVVSFEYRNELC